MGAAAGGRLYFWLGERWTRSERGCRSLERLEAPDKAGGPGFLRGEVGAPDGKNLRTLVDAFETFLGLGNRLNRRNPKHFR